MLQPERHPRRHPRILPVTRVETIMNQTIYSLDSDGAFDIRSFGPSVTPGSIRDISLDHEEHLQLPNDAIKESDLIVRFDLQEILTAGTEIEPALIKALGARATLHFFVARRTVFFSELTRDELLLRAPRQYMTPRLTGMLQQTDPNEAKQFGDDFARLKRFADRAK